MLVLMCGQLNHLNTGGSWTLKTKKRSMIFWR